MHLFASQLNSVKIEPDIFSDALVQTPSNNSKDPMGHIDPMLLKRMAVGLLPIAFFSLWPCGNILIMKQLNTIQEYTWSSVHEMCLKRMLTEWKQENFFNLCSILS